MWLGSQVAAAKKPFVTARKAFLSPWTDCDRKGEGCGARNQKKRRSVSDRLKFRKKI